MLSQLIACKVVLTPLHQTIIDLFICCTSVNAFMKYTAKQAPLQRFAKILAQADHSGRQFMISTPIKACHV